MEAILVYIASFRTSRASKRNPDGDWGWRRREEKGGNGKKEEGRERRKKLVKQKRLLLLEIWIILLATLQ